MDMLLLDLRKLYPPPALTGSPEGSEGKLERTLFVEEARYYLTSSFLFTKAALNKVGGAHILAMYRRQLKMG